MHSHIYTHYHNNGKNAQIVHFPNNTIKLNPKIINNYLHLDNIRNFLTIRKNLNIIILFDFSKEPEGKTLNYVIYDFKSNSAQIREKIFIENLNKDQLNVVLNSFVFNEICNFLLGDILCLDDIYKLRHYGFWHLKKLGVLKDKFKEHEDKIADLLARNKKVKINSLWIEEFMLNDDFAKHAL